MFCNKYKIKRKDFKHMYNMAQEIHGNISLIENFCKNYQDIEDFYKIMPLIKHTNKLSDKLYCFFINICE